MKYTVTPLVSGYRERTNLTLEELFHRVKAWTYYKVPCEIGWGE